MDLYEKLRILADSAKFDVSCSTSGTARSGSGRIGNAHMAGICHTWSADGRCVSLLKVLFSNRCVYDCAYCVNRRSVECARASFEPEELARLTMEFYRRNYIEGLFLSSAVERSPDWTGERILRCLSILRNEYEFAGYIHAKIIPGMSPELVEQIGFAADRLSVNMELPTEKSLALLAPQKKPQAIFRPMKQITNTLIERKGLVGPGTMFKGQALNTPEHYLSGGAGAMQPNRSAIQTDSTGEVHSNRSAAQTGDMSVMPPKQRAAQTGDMSVIQPELRTAQKNSTGVPAVRRRGRAPFAPAGQTTQMIIGASGESDRQILKLSESLYRTFKMKRVFFSAYVPVSDSPLLPGRMTAVPLAREHRMYQADWLLRFYGFQADEILDEAHPFLDPELDPKISWALRHIELFPMEVNCVSFEDLLRIPGVGTTSALRIVRRRRMASVACEDLKRMGVVWKRARYFLTCRGKYYGGRDLDPVVIRNEISGTHGEVQLSMFEEANYGGISVRRNV